MPTAATLVTIGSSTPIRNSVCARSFRFSAFARNSAPRSCGTVAITNMATVLVTAFQKSGSVSSSW